MDGFDLRELHQAAMEIGDGVGVAPSLDGKRTQDVDNRLSAVVGARPEVESEIAAGEVEVEIVDAVLALFSEIPGDLGGAAVLRGDVRDHLGELVLVAALASSFALRSAGFVLLTTSHKFAPPTAV